MVTLSDEELIQGQELGKARNANALKSGKANRFGCLTADQIDVHVLGACGEIAVAKALYIPFQSTIDTYQTVPDVGIYEVRTRSKPYYELLVRPGDKDDSIYILVRAVPSNQLRRFEIVGWLKGVEAKQKVWRKTHGYRPPAYFVPDRALHDIALIAAKSPN